MPKSLNEQILAAANRLSGEAISLRRSLHQIPEVAWQETKTSAALKRFLSKHQVAHEVIAGTGVVAGIDSGKGRCAALRTDIDALPVSEETDYPFKSTHAGRMHACGHDVHMATVTLCALLLKEFKSEFRGFVKILYQPAEEAPPGGAEELVKKGVLKDPKVDMIFGLHVWPTIKVGQIGIKEGALCAGVLDFDIEIVGVGGHGAYPHDTRDPIVCAAQVVIALQTIASRNIDPFEPVVVTIGKIDGGGARNVIPPSCKLSGTARAQDLKTLKLLKRQIESIAGATAKSLGCRAEIACGEGYPPLTNYAEANSYLQRSSEELFGKKSVVRAPKPSMGGEDFAYYLQQVPGAMFLLGIQNPEIGAVYGLHHPRFKADEAAIPHGAAILAKSVIDFLNG